METGVEEFSEGKPGWMRGFHGIENETGLHSKNAFVGKPTKRQTLTANQEGRGRLKLLAVAQVKTEEGEDQAGDCGASREGGVSAGAPCRMGAGG